MKNKVVSLLLLPVWWPFAWQHAGRLTLILSTGLLANIGSVLLPLGIGEFLQLHYAQAGAKGRILQLLGLPGASSMHQLLLAFAAVWCLRMLASWLEKWQKDWMGQLMLADLKQRLQPAGSTRAARASQRDLSPLRRLLFKGVLDAFKHLSFLLMLVAMLFRIQPALCLATLGMCIAGALVSVGLARCQRSALQQYRQLQRDAGSLDAGTQQALAYQRAGRLQAKWQALLKVHNAQWLYAMVGMLLLLVWWLQWPVPAASLVTFYLLLLAAVPSLRGLLGLPAIWMKARLSAGALAGHLAPASPTYLAKGGYIGTAAATNGS
ncbi:MAG: hypothetical protein MUF62_00180 [Chitinophagaceae bacterium]|jgi:hypothetical protein|nr:hypothetical protein [Chitinophagaceae bacterium]